VLYQLSYAPRLRADCIGGPGSTIAAVPMAALFSAITVAFGLIAVWTATAGQYPIALAAGALATWMATLAWSALRKMRP
jgi:hypothetical protein